MAGMPVNTTDYTDLYNTHVDKKNHNWEIWTSNRHWSVLIKKKNQTSWTTAWLIIGKSINNDDGHV